MSVISSDLSSLEIKGNVVWKTSMMKVWRHDKRFLCKTFEILQMLECDGRTKLLWRTYTSEMAIFRQKYLWNKFMVVIRTNGHLKVLFLKSKTHFKELRNINLLLRYESKCAARYFKSKISVFSKFSLKIDFRARKYSNHHQICQADVILCPLLIQIQKFG